MQIRTDKNGYVTDYALIGTIEGGVEVKDPRALEQFEAHFQSYRMRDGTLEYDEKQNMELEQKALCDDLRERRETECFSYINRGQLWYDRLTKAQRQELSDWYEDWLRCTDTLTTPEKPSWLY